MTQEEIVDRLRPIIRDHKGGEEPEIYIHRTAVLEALTAYRAQVLEEAFTEKEPPASFREDAIGRPVRKVRY